MCFMSAFSWLFLVLRRLIWVLPCLVHRYAYLCKSICVAMVLLWLVKLCRSGADSDSNKLFTVLLLAICVPLPIRNP